MKHIFEALCGVAVVYNNTESKNRSKLYGIKQFTLGQFLANSNIHTYTQQYAYDRANIFQQLNKM